MSLVCAIPNTPDDTNFNDKITTKCEMMKKFEDVDLRNIAVKLLDSYGNNELISKHNIIYSSYKDKELANLVAQNLPDDMYNIDTECFKKELRVKMIKIFFSDLYEKYDTFYKLIDSLVVIDNVTCEPKIYDDNINKIELIIGKDKQSGLIKDLDDYLENKNLIYCAGLARFRNQLNPIYDDLQKCKNNKDFKPNIQNFKLLKQSLTDFPFSRCMIIFLYYMRVKYPPPTPVKQQPEKSTDYTGLIIAATIGGIIILIIIIIGIIIFVRRRRRAKKLLSDKSDNLDKEEVKEENTGDN